MRVGWYGCAWMHATRLGERWVSCLPAQPRPSGTRAVDWPSALPFRSHRLRLASTQVVVSRLLQLRPSATSSFRKALCVE